MNLLRNAEGWPSTLVPSKHPGLRAMSAQARASSPACAAYPFLSATTLLRLPYPCSTLSTRSELLLAYRIPGDSPASTVTTRHLPTPNAASSTSLSACRGQSLPRGSLPFEYAGCPTRVNTCDVTGAFMTFYIISPLDRDHAAVPSQSARGPFPPCRADSANARLAQDRDNRRRQRHPVLQPRCVRCSVPPHSAVLTGIAVWT